MQQPMEPLALSESAPRIAETMSTGLVPLFTAIAAGILVMSFAVLVATLYLSPRVPRYT